MSLKKRIVIVISVSIFGLALLTHFIFNLTVYTILKEQHIIPSLQSHILYFIFSMLLAMFVLGIILYRLFDKFILKRVVKISKEMENIEGLKDLSVRIAEDSNRDEISSLIIGINNTLNILEEERIKRESIENQMITNEKLISIGRLSSSIAHEINNPILALSNCFEVLKKHCQGDTEYVRDAFDISESEIKRIRTILSGFLDFHRLEKGEFTEVDLNETLQQSIEMLEWSDKLNHVEIIRSTDNHFTVFGSKGKLKQVFINLMLNSVDAVKDKKGKIRVEISAADQDDYLAIHFYDNGSGVSPEIKDNIFEPFLTTKAQGTGLGLYISYQIIQTHKGEILFDGDYKNGAHFIVKIPIMEGQKSAKNSLPPS
ncbi:MAG: HAMP domain-containing histidine kinase [Candidatus Aminicenantes bacterium]|nr:HAMP domain-containing histidine kinase [Candidatus Aminicenantes bacterium]